jgi:hypothetical protein
MNDSLLVDRLQKKKAIATVLEGYPDGARVVVVSRDEYRDDEAKALGIHVRMTVVSQYADTPDTVISETKLISDIVTGAALIDVAAQYTTYMFWRCSQELQRLFFPRKPA